MGYLVTVLGAPTVLLTALTVYAWWGWGKKRHDRTHVTDNWLADHKYRQGKQGDTL